MSPPGAIAVSCVTVAPFRIQTDWRLIVLTYFFIRPSLWTSVTKPAFRLFLWTFWIKESVSEEFPYAYLFFKLPYLDAILQRQAGIKIPFGPRVKKCADEQKVNFPLVPHWGQDVETSGDNQILVLKRTNLKASLYFYIAIALTIAWSSFSKASAPLFTSEVEVLPLDTLSCGASTELSHNDAP